MNDLLSRHDVLLADLDGTLYRGRSAVPRAVDAVAGAAARGVRTAYVTNNASRTPASVAAHLAELGFPARSSDVATSAQAAAGLLAGRLPTAARVLVVGTDALVAEVAAVGLTPVQEAAAADAVVQGHDPQTGWTILAEAAVALRAGALWVACNVDPTLPTERGPLPGNGAMVAALRVATSRMPDVAGKPGPTLLIETAERTGARSALVVGDRLDTDIEGGRAAGFATLLVLTGVSGADALLAAPPEQRPDHIGADLGALTAEVGSLAAAPRPGWAVVAQAGALRLATTSRDGDALDALRTMCAAHWAGGGGAARLQAADDAAEAALRELGLGADVGEPAPRSATVAGAESATGARR